jgi:hypothetical protein
MVFQPVLLVFQLETFVLASQLLETDEEGDVFRLNAIAALHHHTKLGENPIQ